ncbi:MAG TPA: hypothetical protein VFZ89_03300 [Solirubrobacteraceae bacterium]
MPLLRVPAFRGAQVGAGVVVLATLVVLLDVRMDEWPPETRLACEAGLGVLVWALVIGTPPAEGTPRPWLAALCLSAILLLTLALGHVVDLLGADGFYGLTEGDPPYGGLAGAMLAVCVAAGWCARRRDAASCALIAGVAGTLVVLLWAGWAVDPSRQTLRWLLALCALVLLVLTLAQRDGKPEHGAQLANAGGLAVAGIGHTAGLGPFALLFFASPVSGLGAGWELLLLAAGFGLLAYGAVDGHRGPVVIGLINVATFIEAAARDDSGFVGWPLVLLLAGLALLAIGLRPTTPAPPEPGWGTEPPPPIDVTVR